MGRRTSVKDESQPEIVPKRRDLANILVWVLIGILTALTAAWVLWGSRQEKTDSSWTPDD